MNKKLSGFLKCFLEQLTGALSFVKDGEVTKQ